MSPDLRDFIIELAERFPDLYNYEVVDAVEDYMAFEDVVLTTSVETKVLALYSRVAESPAGA
jgi:hypothetical protein